jgi:tetratricopeptide (TPR) repeat protein
MVHVNMGLLLRAQNEAQLASVLGHEITHYTERHTLQQFRTMRNTSTVLAFLSLGMAGASVAVGVNLTGAADLASMVAVLSFYSYSRDQEREADSGGFELMVAHGYDPHESVAVWRNVLQEADANPDRRGTALFLRTHPTEEERIENLQELADEVDETGPPREIGTDRYREVVLPHRKTWLERELGRAEYEESIALMKRLIELDPDSGELRFFLGEAHRRRNEAGDAEAAVAAYQDAISRPDAPVEAYRGLGMVALKEGVLELARSSFESYLQLAPEADDHAMVQLYLSRAGGE